MGKQTKPSDLLIRESVDALDAFMQPGTHSLIEADTKGDELFNDDGTVNIVLLRPGMGRGPAAVGGPAGKRIYTKEVLQRDAGVFTGWGSFMNHDSPAARRARGGLPRPPSDLAGELVETWWDDDVASPRDAELGFDKGGVVGKLMPATDEAEQLIRRVPRRLKFSIFGAATGLTPGQWRGDQGVLVEGIQDDPENSSFDMVTKAGAGGEVAALIESLADDDGPSGSGGGYDDSQNDEPDSEDGIDMGGLTLQEALETDEVKGFIGTLVEAKVDELRPGLEEQAQEKARAEVATELEGAKLLRLSTQAKALIEAAKLPEAFTADLIETYGVTDDGTKIVGGRGLQGIAPEMEGEEVKKTASEVLKDRVEADVKRERAKLVEASPTIPIAPGGGEGGEGSTAGIQFGGPGSAFAERARSMGLSTPKAPPAPAATT